MCGISGIFNYTSSREPSAELSVRKMLSVIRHRGPDESGIYLGKNVAMGSVRLSIIDIASGQQPMCDESGNYWIVYNGEIFNYAELRKELIQRGIQLKTHSDTEVLVQMYALHGSDCLKYFNGQFAFCIFDKKKNELFLGRDRVGIRPLFYWSQNDAFAFCSEIKGLFTLNEIPRMIRPESLAQVFTFWTTTSPHTPFTHIYELPPGCYMKVTSSGIDIKKYWQLEYAEKGKETTASLEEAGEKLTDLLKDAVRIRLRADVPVAAYLSGGLDSSVTTSYIHEIEPGVLNTFSIGFKDKTFDETPFQIEASKYFHTNHTAFECTSEEIAEQFLNTVWHGEFPIVRTAPTPMFMLSKKVRERNIKVVITGEGADEMLAGYNIFKETKIRRFWAKEPNSTCRPKLLSKLYPYLPMMKDSNVMALKLFFGYRLTDTQDPLYSHLLRWHNTSRIKAFFSDDFRSTLAGYEPLEAVYASLPENFGSWSDLSKSQYLEAKIFMSGYLLSSQGDRMAMGNSVEGRYPFLDYRVIEYCNQLPERYKLNSLNEKFILKKISEGRIPGSIAKRSKQPYRAPIASSFFGPAAPKYVGDILSESVIRDFGIFDTRRVSALVQKMQTHKEIPEVDQMAITGILSTQLLHQIFVKDPIVPKLPPQENVRVIRDY